MKYYACSGGHWWHCADTKQLRKNHCCRYGVKLRCNKLLKYQGTTVPAPKRSEKRIRPEPLPHDQLEDDTTAIAVNTNAPTITFTDYYKCTSSVKQHLWKCTARIDRPENAQCPALVPPFNARCGKPLEKLLAVLLEDASYTPLDASQFNQTFVVHNYAPMMPTLTFDERPPRKFEAQSQKQLTLALIQSGIALLCRDGQFRTKPAIATSEQHQQAFVDEPGITNVGPLFATVTTSCMSVIGRLEVGNHHADTYIINPFISGTVTYPDFTVEQNGQKFAVELKTPNTGTMAQYIAGSFYKERTDWGRPVEEEITKRAAILPEDYLQMLAFDLANLTEPFQASVLTLQTEIREGEHRAFWQLITGFLFFDPAHGARTYSKDQFLMLHSTQSTLGFVTTPSLVVNNTNNQKEGV